MAKTGSRRVQPGPFVAASRGLAGLSVIILACAAPSRARAAPAPDALTEAPARAPAASALAVAPDPAPGTPRPKRVHQHGLGLGYHGVVFATERSDRYVIHGPALVYDYFIGRRWGFMARASAFALVSGRMSGPSGEFTGALGSYYDQRNEGFDGMLMVGRRLPMTPRLVVTAGGGAHFQAFALTSTYYSPVENVSVGLGGLGKLDYVLNGWLTVSGQVAVGLDLIDLADHKNPASWVIPIATSFALAGYH